MLKVKITWLVELNEHLVDLFQIFIFQTGHAKSVQFPLDALHFWLSVCELFFVLLNAFETICLRED